MHVLAFQWNKYVDTIYTPSIFYTPSFFIMTRKAWDKLDKDVQDTFFDKEVVRLRTETIAAIHKADDDALKALIGSGVTEVKIPPKQLKEIRQKTQKAWKKLTGTHFSPELVNMIQKHLDEYRKQNPEN